MNPTKSFSTVWPFAIRFRSTLLKKLLVALFVPLLFAFVAEWLARKLIELPPRTFFVEEVRDGKIWVTDNPFYGQTFQHPQQARSPAQNLFQKEKPEGVFRILLLGESAAMGFPRPEFGLARMLHAHLALRGASKHIEVIDGTMTLISSHLLREIAAEGLRYEPDLVLVYAGNNEVIGPYGPSAVFGYPFRSRGIIRFDRWLRRNSSLFGWLASRRIDWQFADDQRWRGLEHFEGKSLPPNDPSLDRVSRFFESNIESIARAAGRRNIPALIALPSVNLVDWPPLLSIPQNTLSGVAQQEYDLQLDQAYELISSQASDDALQLLAELLERYPQCANIAYAKALAWFEQGDHQAVRHWAEQACSWDGYRFRATRELSESLRSIANRHPTVHLVDTRSALFQQQVNQDRPLFLEHVHFTALGTHELARRIVPSIAEIFPQWGAADVSTVDFDEIASALFYLADIESESWQAAHQFLQMTVFRGQRDHVHRMQVMLNNEQYANEAANQVSVESVQQKYREAGATYVQPDWLLDFLYGRYLVRRGHVRLAQAPLQRVRIRKPNHAQAYEWLGYVYYTQSDFAAAIETLEAGLAINPFMPEALNTLGLSHFRLGQTEIAERWYLEALRVDPEHSGALNNLGYLMMQSGELEEAERLLRASLSIRAEALEPKYHLALVYQYQQRWEESADLLERVTKLFPDLARAWISWAAALQEVGEYESAVTRLDQALSIEPQRHDARMQRGYILLTRLDNVDGALNDFQVVLRALPDQPAARFWAGMAMVRSGDYDVGIEEMSLALRSVPSNVDWYMEAAKAIMEITSPDDQYLQSAARWANHVLELTEYEHDEAARLFDQVLEQLRR